MDAGRRGMGFDAGRDQLDALADGSIDGLVVQNPFGMGYATVVAAARTVLEIGNEAQVDTGFVWVDADNMEDENIQAYIDDQNAVPCKDGDFELAPMLDGMTSFIEAGNMTDYQDHYYPSEMAADALIQTYLINKDADAFLNDFDARWQRYNRDIIRAVQEYNEEHGTAE